MPEGAAVVVTGAGSGNGRALCAGLLDLRTRAAAIALTTETLAWIARVDGVVIVAGDIGSSAINPGTLKTAVSEFGRLDGPALNAGIDPKTVIEEQPMEDPGRVLQTNLRGPALRIRAALPALRPGGVGSIDLTSPMGGLFGLKGRSAGSVAKAGLDNLSRTVAMEVGSKNVRVNAGCPGANRGDRFEYGVAQKQPAVSSSTVTPPP